MPATKLEYYKIGHLYQISSPYGKIAPCLFASSASPDGHYTVDIHHGSVVLCIGSVIDDLNRIYGLFLCTNIQGQSEEFACGDWKEDASWLTEI